MGLFIVIGAFAVFAIVHIRNLRRDPAFRQAQRDWITLRDPFGLRAWRNHWRTGLQPLLAAILWLVFWLEVLEVTRGFGT